MRILFDQGTPRPLRRQLVGHVVETAGERGWGQLANGVLLATAEQAGYDLLITTDQHMRYQQNLTGRRLSILVLTTTRWTIIREQLPRFVQGVSTIATMGPGAYLEVAFDQTP